MQSITASVVPASSILTVGQSLSETVNWPVFTSASNFTTQEVGHMISNVKIDYLGDTANATDLLGDGDLNNFSVTVTDTAGNVRTFSVIPQTVQQVAPAVVGTIPDLTLTQATGTETYGAAAAFTGAALTFSVSGPAGVSIEATTGLLSLDTDVLAEGADLPVTVTASNSGGSVSLGFALTVQPAIVYGASVTGLTNNPTHGLTAQIGSPLTGQITPLTGTETISHRWRLDGSLIAGAMSTTYTPAAGEDLGQLRYAPLVNGSEVASPAYQVRHAPPVAGLLAPVEAIAGGGLILVDLASGFSGESLNFSESVGWAAISGSTLTINDAVRSDTVTVTATNSGGQATVDLSVTITAPITAPAQMVAPALQADSATQFTVTLAADPDDGGASITQRDIRWRPTGGSWTSQNGITSPVAVSGVAEFTSHEVQSRVRNSAGSGIWSASASVTTLLNAPVAANSLADQTFSDGTGVQSYAVASDFAGLNLTYAINAVPGVSINASTGVISFDTDIMPVQAETAIIVTAINASGSAQSAFSLDIVDVVETDFVLTIETTTPNEPFTLPMRNTGSYNASIDFGDGNSATGLTSHDAAGWTHIYATPGIHTLRVSGQAGAPLFNGSPDRNKLRTVENFGTWNGTDMREAFRGCAGLTSFAFGNSNTSFARLWTNFVGNCDALTTLDFTGVDTSAATNFRVFAAGCALLQSVTGIADIDTSNLEQADEMFWSCPNLNTSNFDISEWNLESLLPPVGSNFRGLFNFFPNNKVLSQAVYDAFLSNLDTQSLAPGIFIGLKQTPYTTGGAAEAARTSLIGTKGISLEDAGNAAPEPMAAPSLIVDGDTQITATLAANPFTNGLPILSYDLRFSNDLVNWTLQNNVSSPVVLTGLEAGTQVYVQARANNYNSLIGSPSDWSPSAVVTTTGGIVPFAATRSGTDLTLTGLPDISPQAFALAMSGADLTVTFTGTPAIPAPTQIAIIEAAHHDGTEPDTGSYGVQILDLGTPVGDVHTLPGVSLANDTMVVLLDPRSDVVGGGLAEFERVVFIGASIMDQTFGSSLTQRVPAAEAAFAAQGAAVEVYAHAASGFDAEQVQALLSEALGTFPDKTLFFVHAGGNDVTLNRPYPGGEDALASAVDGLIDIAATRPGAVVISDLTFRDYGDVTAADEAAGAKPYNDTIYLPALQARQSELLARAYYTDGTPVTCLYEWSWENRTAYLGSDNIHPADPGGRVLLRDWLAERLAPICLGLPAPAQFTRTDQSPAIDIFVNYGVQTAPGVNTPGFTFLAASGQTSDGPFDLLNTDGSDPGVTLALNFSAPATGSSNGFGINVAGNGDGTPGFDGTLYSSIFTGDSYFVGAAFALDHVIAGLAANTAYRVVLVASRNAGGTRETGYDFANGETATIQTTADPTQSPVVIDTVSDGAGRIIITQSTISGSWSYLGGLRITTA